MGGWSRSTPTDDLNILSGCFYTTLAGCLTGVYYLKCRSKLSINFHVTCFFIELIVSSDAVIADVCHETSSLVTCVKCLRQFNGKWVAPCPLRFLASDGCYHPSH